MDLIINLIDCVQNMIPLNIFHMLWPRTRHLVPVRQNLPPGRVDSFVQTAETVNFDLS